MRGIVIGDRGGDAVAEQVGIHQMPKRAPLCQSSAFRRAGPPRPEQEAKPAQSECIHDCGHKSPARAVISQP
jgi:hypothetical protein